MVGIVYLGIQAISCVIQEGSNPQYGNRISVLFFGWIGLKFIDVVLSLNIKIFAFIRLKTCKEKPKFGFRIWGVVERGSHHPSLESCTFFTIKVNPKGIGFISRSEISIGRLWGEAVIVRRIVR